LIVFPSSVVKVFANLFQKAAVSKGETLFLLPLLY